MYAETTLLAGKEECQLGRAYLAVIKCIATLSTNAGVSDMAFFLYDCGCMLSFGVSKGIGSGLVFVCVSFVEYGYRFLINNVHLEESG